MTVLTVLTIPTQSICRSTTRMRVIRKQRNNVGLRGKPEPLNANESWKQLASSLERMSVDPLLRSPVNIGLLPLFQIG